MPKTNWGALINLFAIGYIAIKRANKAEIFKVKGGVRNSKPNDKEPRNIKNNQASSKLTTPVAIGLPAVLFTNLSN
jgi:hypothetical protein